MKLGDAGHIIHQASLSAVDVSKAAFAGITGAILTVNQLRRALGAGVKTAKGTFRKEKTQKTSEVVTMKKSTVIALFAALAAVAGVLGALYVYVLRREKELDEYEQLLFSEDFDDEDDLGEDIEALLAEDDKAE